MTAVLPREVAQWAQDRRRRGQEEARQRAATLLLRLPSAVASLRERYGPVRVWLFGSLVHGQVHSHSDVDLAVEGLAPADTFAAAALLMDALGSPVDLIPMDGAAPSLVERVLREGRPL